MAGGGGRLLLGVAICVGLMVAGGEASTSLIIGMAQCPSCSRKSMNAEAAFKGLKVAIKCNNGSSSSSAGEYVSKAVGDLDGTGAFAVHLPADVDLRGSAKCVAQLHSAASSAPCPGQEPSMIVPLSVGEGTFLAVAGKTTRAVSTTPECASANICFPCHMFGRKPFYMHRRMKPFPGYGMPAPVYTPAPVYGTPAPRCLCTPTPEPGCQCQASVYGTPMPEYYPPPAPEFGTPTPDCPPEAPEYGTPTPAYATPTVPVYGTPAPRCMCSPTPEAGCECPTAAPTPVYGTPMPRCLCTPTPEAGCQCPTSTATPVYGTPMAQPPPPTPVYGTPMPRCLCTPTPEAGCQCPTQTPAPVYGTPTAQLPPPTPVYEPPAPVYGALPTPTPVYGTPVAQIPPPTPVYGTPTPVYGPPAPVLGAPPTPECPPATPEVGTPIYTPPAHH